jgi:hypothetical protein
MVNVHEWQRLSGYLSEQGVTLVAVSKTKPVGDIQQLYDLGQREFGENYVQELVEKQPLLPADIRWHFIGHLQSNKVKYIAPFVSMIHGVDNQKLLVEINKQAIKNNRVIDVLLQMYIADEATKFGMDETEIRNVVASTIGVMKNVRIRGLMGMATNTSNLEQVGREFAHLRLLFNDLSAGAFSGENSFSICSMGMSGDYELAIKNGSTLVRIGSLLFGNRN